MSVVRILWRIYRVLIFPVLYVLSGGGASAGCRHQPSCSVYALQVIEQDGWMRGFPRALKRVMSCHPWGESN